MLLGVIVELFDVFGFGVKCVKVLYDVLNVDLFE